MHSMILLLISFIQFSKTQPTSVPYVHRGVEIEDCDSDPSGTQTELKTNLQCVIGSTKLKFTLSTTKSNIKINNIIYKEKSKVGKATVCKKSSGAEYEIDVNVIANINAIVYTDNSESKAILFGSDTSKCYEVFDASETELKSEYLQITSIKCVTKTKVDEYVKSKKDKTPNEFLEDESRICFLASMLKKDITFNVKLLDTTYPLTISSVPKQECPKCPIENATNTETAAQSSKTTVIIVVVVIVVVILIGGLTYVMSTK